MSARSTYVRVPPSGDLGVKRMNAKNKSIKTILIDKKVKQRYADKKTFATFKKSTKYKAVQNIQAILDINKTLRTDKDKKKIKNALSDLGLDSEKTYKLRMRNRKSILSTHSEIMSGRTEFTLHIPAKLRMYSNSDLFNIYLLMRESVTMVDPYLAANNNISGGKVSNLNDALIPIRKNFNTSYSMRSIDFNSFSALMATASPQDFYTSCTQTEAVLITALTSANGGNAPSIGFNDQVDNTNFVTIYSPFLNDTTKLDWISYISLSKVNYDAIKPANNNDDPIIEYNNVYINSLENSANIGLLIPGNKYKFDTFHVFVWKMRVYAYLQNSELNYWTIIGPPDGTKDDTFLTQYEVKLSANNAPKPEIQVALKPNVAGMFNSSTNNMRIWEVIPNSYLDGGKKKDTHPFLLNLDENVNSMILKYDINDSTLLTWSSPIYTELVKTYTFYTSSQQSQKLETIYSLTFSLPNSMLYDQLFTNAPLNGSNIALDFFWTDVQVAYETRKHIDIPHVLANNIINVDSFSNLKFIIPAYQQFPMFRQFDVTNDIKNNILILQCMSAVLRTFTNIGSMLQKMNAYGMIKPKVSMKCLVYASELFKNWSLLTDMGGLAKFLSVFKVILTAIGSNLIDQLTLLTDIFLTQNIEALKKIANVYDDNSPSDEDVVTSIQLLWKSCSKFTDYRWGFTEFTGIMAQTVTNIVTQSKLYLKGKTRTKGYDVIIARLNIIADIFKSVFTSYGEAASSEQALAAEWKKSTDYVNGINKINSGAVNTLSIGEKTAVDSCNAAEKNSAQKSSEAREILAIAGKFFDEVVLLWSTGISNAWIDDFLNVKMSTWVNAISDPATKLLIISSKRLKRLVQDNKEATYAAKFPKIVNVVDDSNNFIYFSGAMNYEFATIVVEGIYLFGQAARFTWDNEQAFNEEFNVTYKLTDPLVAI